MVAVLANVHQERGKCNELQRIHNRFCQKPAQSRTAVCTEAHYGFQTQLKNKNSLFS